MTEGPRIIKDRTPVRHFAARAMWHTWYFPVCGLILPADARSLGPRLTDNWKYVTCKRCLKSRWAGSVTR